MVSNETEAEDFLKSSGGTHTQHLMAQCAIGRLGGPEATMLETSLLESRPTYAARKPLTVTVSVALHAVAVSVLLLMPLIYTSALPIAELPSGVLAPPVRIEDKIELAPPLEPRVVQVTQVSPGDLIAPTVIPREIASIIESPDAAPPVFSPLFGAASVRDLLRSTFPGPPATAEAAPPPPPPMPVPVATGPIRISAGVQQGNLIHQVTPDYPRLAREARVEGVVVLEALIGGDGSVQNVRVISGHPLLTQAAIDAVSLWQYRPTLLNGEPVEVVTTVTMTFRIGE